MMQERRIIDRTIYSVYALIDPRTEVIHYIGMTQNIHTRLETHISCRDGNAEKIAWIQELRSFDLTPTLAVLEMTCDKERVLEAETFWISYYVAQGLPLKNKMGNINAISDATRKAYERRERQEKYKREQIAKGLIPVEVEVIPMKVAKRRDQPCESKLYTFTPEEEVQVLELHKQGLSTNKIFGTMRKGARYASEIKRITGEYESSIGNSNTNLESSTPKPFEPLDWNQYDFGLVSD